MRRKWGFYRQLKEHSFTVRLRTRCPCGYAEKRLSQFFHWKIICSLGWARLPLPGQVRVTWESKISGKVGVVLLPIPFCEFSLKRIDLCAIKSAYALLFLFSWRGKLLSKKNAKLRGRNLSFQGAQHCTSLGCNSLSLQNEDDTISPQISCENGREITQASGRHMWLRASLVFQWAQMQPHLVSTAGMYSGCLLDGPY